MEKYHHPRPNIEDYEYTVCDSTQYSGHSSLPIVLVMKYQEGFEWNEIQAQCKRHKSKFRKEREELIRQACSNTGNTSNSGDGKNSSHQRYQDRVMEIELSAKDKDILP
ncbi:unnamed protein product [Cunninghamella blakesleeana]